MVPLIKPGMTEIYHNLHLRRNQTSSIGGKGENVRFEWDLADGVGPSALPVRKVCPVSKEHPVIKSISSKKGNSEHAATRINAL